MRFVATVKNKSDTEVHSYGPLLGHVTLDEVWGWASSRCNVREGDTLSLTPVVPNEERTDEAE